MAQEYFVYSGGFFCVPVSTAGLSSLAADLELGPRRAGLTPMQGTPSPEREDVLPSSGAPGTECFHLDGRAVQSPACQSSRSI